MNSEWLEILNRVQKGEITAQQGADLLQQLEASTITPPGTTPMLEEPSRSGSGESEPVEAVEPDLIVEESDASRFSSDPQADQARMEDDIKRLNAWRIWWLAPFGAGLGIFVLSAVLMAWGYSNDRLFWFYCAWLPLALGLVVLVLGAWSRQARWLHLRINEPVGEKGKGPQRVAISLPLPTRLAGWMLRLAGPRIPKLNDQKLETIVPMLDSLSDSREPLMVEVDGKDGEKVQVYII